MSNKLGILALLVAALNVQTVAHSATPSKKQRTLYVARVNRENVRLVPVREEKANPTPLGALKALASFKGEGDKKSTLPKGTRILGVKVEPSGTAVVNFSREIVENFTGGSESEMILLGSIVNTLAQFPSIQRVAVRVEGRPVDSIGGHIELTEPLEKELMALDTRESPELAKR